VAVGCRLRYLFETEESQVFKISNNVNVLLGRVVHEAIDAAYKRRSLNDHVAVRQYVVSRLLELAGAENTVRSILASLKLVLSESTLVAPTRIADIVRIAVYANNSNDEIRDVQVAPTVARQDRKHHRSAENHSPSRASIFRSESELFSVRLNLAGRADKVERLSGGNIRIADYKLGNALDESGRLREEYRLQIGAYALIVSELYPGVRIQLRVIAADGVWEGALTSETRTEVEALVRTLAIELPLGARKTSEELATTGEKCFGCQYRPSCPAYKSWAPTQWSAVRGRLPLDTWGIVQSVERRTDRLVDVRIIDGAARHVRVVAIPSEMLEKFPIVGHHLELYELKSFETVGQGKFPRNFYIANVSQPFLSAFSTVTRIRSAH
jgi:RecB family exonuclease